MKGGIGSGLRMNKSTRKYNTSTTGHELSRQQRKEKEDRENKIREQERIMMERFNFVVNKMSEDNLLKKPENISSIKRENIIWENIDCNKFNNYNKDTKDLIKNAYNENKDIEEKYNNVKSYTGLKIGHKKPMVIPEDVKECLNSKLESTAGGGRNRKTKRNKNLCRGKSVKRPNKCKKVKGCKVAKGKKRTYCRKAHNKRRVTSKKR
tara:strand:+ start:736 stop:1359 length:624 start_codon:yes stop_codon:yes gene_type:complete